MKHMLNRFDPIKRTAVLACTAILGALLSACGGSTAAAPTAVPTSAPTAAPIAAPTSAPTENFDVIEIAPDNATAQ